MRGRWRVRRSGGAVATGGEGTGGGEVQGGVARGCRDRGLGERGRHCDGVGKIHQGFAMNGYGLPNTSDGRA